MHIDGTKPIKPVVTLKKDNESGSAYEGNWYNGDVYSGFTATDEGSGIDHYEFSEYRVTWESLPDPSKLITVDGDKTWYVRVVDKTGNIGDYETYHTKIDKGKPSIPVVTLKKDNADGETYDGTWYSGDVYSTFVSTPSISGIDHYEISSDGTSWTQLGINSKTIEDSGDKTWYVRAVSVAGNPGDYATFTTKIDKEKPVVTLGDIVASPGTMTIPYTATDALSGIKTVTCEYGLTTDYGETATSEDGKFSFPTSTHVIYYYKITATDNAGNVLEVTGSSESGGFNDVHITGDPDVSRWTPSRTITISGETPGAYLEYKVIYTSTPENNVSEWTQIENGHQLVFDETTTTANPIYVYARFNNGVETSDEVTYTETKIDTTKPLVNTGAPSATSNSTTIQLNVSDPESGIEKTICEYGTTENGFNVASVETTTSTCSFTDLDKDPTYYYKITTYNNAGLTRFMYLFEYTEDAQTFDAEVGGMYKIEAYGGGGESVAGSSTKGSYATATTLLIPGSNLYVYVGGREKLYNGGGVGGDTTHMNTSICGSTVNNVRSTNGSGATDIRLEKSTASDGWSGDNSLLTRLVTAAGGGGAKKNTGRGFNGATPQNRCFDSTSCLYGYGVDGELSNGVLGQGSAEVFGTSVITGTGDYGWGASAGGGGGWYGGKTTAAHKSTANYSDVFYGGHAGTRNGWVTINGNRMVGVEVHAYAGTSRVQNGYTYGNRIYSLEGTTQVGVNTGNGYLKIIEDNLDVTIPTFGDLTISCEYNKNPLDVVGLEGLDEAPYAKYATCSIASTGGTGTIQYKLGDGDWQDYTNSFRLNKNTTIYARSSTELGVSDIVTYVVSGIYIYSDDITYNGTTTVQDALDDIYGRIGG